MRAALVALLAACGGGNGGNSDASGGGDASKPAHSGYVQAQSIDAMNVPGTPIQSGTASAGFFTSGAACTMQQQLGPCVLQTCTTGLTGAASAGLITISGGAETMTLAPAMDKTYAQQTASERLFMGGETLTYSAQGADIPAFTKTLTAPARATITSPAKPSTSLAVSRTQDLTVTWTGGAGGKVQVALIGATIASTLLCRFEASAGTGTIPAAALAMLPAGNGGFAMASIADTEQDTGDWAIDVSAYFNAVWPDDSIVSGGTTYQ